MSEEDSLVRLIQKWNGIRPVINCGRLLREYYKHLADNYIKTKKQQYMEAKKSKKHHQHKWQNRTIINENKDVWFERLLQTPIPDWRKNVIDLILTRYLINVKHLPFEESYIIIKDWLDRCSSQCSARKRLQLQQRDKVEVAIRRKVWNVADG